MVGAVTGEEGDGSVVVLEDVDGCGRVTPGSERVDSCNGDETVELLETGSTDDSDMDCIYMGALASSVKEGEYVYLRMWLGGLLPF